MTRVDAELPRITRLAGVEPTSSGDGRAKPLPASSPTRPPFPKESVGRREAFFRDASAFTGLVLAETQRGSYLVNTWDLKVGLILFRRGARGEQRLLRMGAEVLRHLGLGERLEGSTFLDVGANIGTSCISALIAENFAAAVALEPHPDNCRLLRANAVLNDLDERIVVLNVAASSADGEAHLALSGVNSGGHRIVDAGSRKNTLPVEAVTLDTLVARGVIDVETLGLWFMDAQGHEGEIICGAERILAAGTPILTEYDPTGLSAVGGLELLHERLIRHYTHVIDMATATGLAPPTYELMEIARLPELAERFAEGFSDLLVVRL